MSLHAGDAGPSSPATMGTPPPSSSPSSKPAPDVRVLRVAQVDAGRLDDELVSLLREQFNRMFAMVFPGAVTRRQSELTLLLDALVFYFTVWSHRPTPGMELMNLRYRDERRPLSGKSGMEGHRLSVAQRLAHGVAFVAGRFLWSKLTRAVHDARWSDAEPHTWRHRAWRAVGHAENAHAVASLVNLLLFLRSGRFRTPWERISRARLVYREPNTARVVSFEYLNRQILWRELSDLALFLLPMLDPARLRDAAASVPVARRVIRRKPKTRRRERVVERIRIRNRPRAIDRGGRRTRTRTRTRTVRGVRGETSDGAVRGGTVRTRALLLLREGETRGGSRSVSMRRMRRRGGRHAESRLTKAGCAQVLA